MAYQPPPHAKPLDLSGAHSKVEWAKKHIGNLSDERVRFLGANRYLGIPQFDLETNRTRFIAPPVPPVPAEISLRLGDIAHNLRTALDYVARETVRSIGGDPGNRIYFPICETIEKYVAESDGKTKGMPQEAKDFIDSIGPYGGHDNLLWGLHELDRIDKHHLLLTITLEATSWSATLDSISRDYKFSYTPALKEGDIIGEIEGNSEPDKQMTVSADIAFGEPKVFEGQTLFPTLTILADYVEMLIRQFGA